VSDESTQPHEGPVIRDKRRIDPATGQLREPAAQAAGTPGATGTSAALNEEQFEAGEISAEIAVLAEQLAERTADVQRLQAEYANYRKRVDRDRDLVREQAVAAALAELLPVLDDVGRAREHGELEGGFKSVGEALEAATARLGLAPFGAVGEPFDPTQHEALTHEHRDDVAEATCVAVYQAGYRFADRVIRPARVAVAEPTPGGPPEGGEPV
jgi:molecular chaperone GrpE